MPESRVGKNDCKTSIVRLTANPRARDFQTFATEIGRGIHLVVDDVSVPFIEVIASDKILALHRIQLAALRPVHEGL
jgi:hypothetical protein